MEEFKLNEMRDKTVYYPVTTFFKDLQLIELKPNETQLKEVDTKLGKKFVEVVKITAGERGFSCPTDAGRLLSVLATKYDEKQKDFSDKIEIELKNLANMIDGKYYYSEVKRERLNELKNELMMWASTIIILDVSKSKDAYLSDKKDERKAIGMRMKTHYTGALVPNKIEQDEYGRETVTFYEFPPVLAQALDVKQIETIPHRNLDVSTTIGKTGEEEPSGQYNTASNKAINDYLLTVSQRMANRNKKMPYAEIKFETIRKHLEETGTPVTKNASRFNNSVVGILEVLKAKKGIGKYEIISKGRTKFYKIKLYKMTKK